MNLIGAPNDITVDTATGSMYVFSPTVIATGDFCDVYLGTAPHNGKDQEAVIKVARDPAHKKFLDREQEVLGEFWELIHADPEYRFFGHTLPHPRGKFNVDTDEGVRPAAAMKKARGYTASYIRDLHPIGIPPVQVAWMLTRLLTTLATSHKQGWIHGSVLPQNLMVDWDNNKGHRYAKVLGWGTALKTGTPMVDLFPDCYLFYPPEAFNKGPATPATDIFMFGQTANHLLGGDLAKRKLPSTVPAPLRGALQSCLIPNPHRRPHNTSKFLFDVLRPALAQVWGAPKYVPFTLPVAAGDA